MPEANPPMLGDWFIYLSIIVLICGVIAIMALEWGTPISSPWVKVPMLIGGLALVAVTVDAIVRIWRSAWAWLSVERGRGLFRFVWVGVLLAALLVTLAGMLLVLTA